MIANVDIEALDDKNELTITIGVLPQENLKQKKISMLHSCMKNTTLATMVALSVLAEHFDISPAHIDKIKQDVKEPDPIDFYYREPKRKAQWKQEVSRHRRNK